MLELYLEDWSWGEKEVKQEYMKPICVETQNRSASEYGQYLITDSLFNWWNYSKASDTEPWTFSFYNRNPTCKDVRHLNMQLFRCLRLKSLIIVHVLESELFCLFAGEKFSINRGPPGTCIAWQCWHSSLKHGWLQIRTWSGMSCFLLLVL